MIDAASHVLDYTRLDEAVRTLNTLANHPDILPAVAPGHESVDLRDLFTKDPRTCLIGDIVGGLLFIHLAENIFGAHFLLTPGRRGKEGLEFARDCANVMFSMRGADLLCGAVPRSNRASRAISRALHGLPIGESIDASGRRCINYVLERDRWAILSAHSFNPREISKLPSSPKPGSTTPKVPH